MIISIDGPNDNLNPSKKLTYKGSISIKLK